MRGFPGGIVVVTAWASAWVSVVHAGPAGESAIPPAASRPLPSWAASPVSGERSAGPVAPHREIGARVLAPSHELLSQVRECSGKSPDRFYEFYFTRAIYSEFGGDGFRGRGYRGGGDWAMDYPKADCQFIAVVKRLAALDMFEDSNATRLDDPKLRRFPFLYALEVGRNGGMNLSDAEVMGLRNYLTAGGFLVIDDFWGSWEWENFEREISRVLPGREIVEIPADHTLFRIFYDIDEIIQVPISGNAYNIAMGYPGAVTYENDGYVPHVRGIFDAQGRPMVIINWNTDLGDAWEYAESPYYPLHFSTFAFRMGVNLILYGMTH